jgi:hypothetical protein
VAGDWIKIRKSLMDDPDVYAIADMTGLEVDTVIGKLCRLWCWADTHCAPSSSSRSGHAARVTETHLDGHARANQFARALVSVGWLRVDSEGATFVNFERHMSQSAKARALASSRQVTKRSRAQRDKSVTREEKRREEKNTNTKPPVVPLRFDEFWRAYPARNGRKLGRKKCLRLFAAVPEADLEPLMKATLNYSRSQAAGDNFAKDPERFLRNDWWRDWLEPVISQAASGQRILTREEIKAGMA